MAIISQLLTWQPHIECQSCSGSGISRVFLALYSMQMSGGVSWTVAWSLLEPGGSRSGSTDAGAEQMDSILAGWWFQTFFYFP